jgi:7,8-dihydroneopterin aldolase/epimerase/oxygenase
VWRKYVICADLKMSKMRYKTTINDIEFFSFHGLYPDEKLTGGNFIVDVIVEQDLDDKASMKRLVEVVNYENLFSIVKHEMDQPKDLIETVAKNILDTIGSRIHHIKLAEVKITKLNPGGLFKSGSASVSLSRIFE